jgi:predicted  nucleic acid-binding Zn-ribbon protein
MAQDISEFKSVRYSSEASLKKTNDELALAQRDVARLKREIDNLRQYDNTKTQSLKDLERRLTEKESQLKSAMSSKDSEVSRLNASVGSFSSEKEKLLAEVEKLSKWKSKAEETIATQCKQIESINSQLQRMERDLSGNPSSEYETLLKERASLIEQLARVKSDLVQKNDKIRTTKIQTENLLRRNLSYSSSSPSGGTGVRTVRTPILSNNVVVGEFTSRRRNLATDAPSSMIETVSAPPKQEQASVSTSPAFVAPPKQAEKVVTPPRNPPTLSEVSNMAATLTKEKPTPSTSSTMSAYDLAISRAQQAAAEPKPAATMAPKPKQETATAPKPEAKVPAAPMSGWAGYKDSRHGGYLDNLSEKQTDISSPKSEPKGYQYKDNAQKGFGYLDHLSAPKPAENSSPSQTDSARKEGYLASEKQYLLEAKNLALTAAKSFQEAQSKPNDRDALERANSEKRKVDDLLQKAKEMRAKAEEIST